MDKTLNVRIVISPLNKMSMENIEKQIHLISKEWWNSGHPKYNPNHFPGNQYIRNFIVNPPYDLPNEDCSLDYLMLYSIYHGINWNFWVNFNHSKNIIKNLINMICCGYTRPMRRSLYSLQYFNSNSIKKELIGFNLSSNLLSIFENYMYNKKLIELIIEDPHISKYEFIRLEDKKRLVKSIKVLSPLILRELKNNKSLIYDINPNVFEELIGEIFAREGFIVELTKRTCDGGKDIIALKSDLGIQSKWIIECKRYKENKISVSLARQLYGVKQSENAQQAVLVTTSTFSEPANAFARSVEGLSLIDYRDIINWIENYNFAESGALFIDNRNPNNLLHGSAKSCAP